MKISKAEQESVGASPYSIYGRNNDLPLYSTEDKRSFTGLNVKQITFDEQTGTAKQFVISNRYEFRPDLLSYFFYQTPLLGWYICEYNGIIDPFDVNEGLYTGRLISIPSKNKLLTRLY